LAVSIIGSGGVVEKGNNLYFAVGRAGEKTGVMLEGEDGILGDGKGGVMPTESPEDGPVLAGDFVERVGVATREEEVALVIDVNRVDVDVIPGVEAAGAGLVVGAKGDDGF